MNLTEFNLTHLIHQLFKIYIIQKKKILKNTKNAYNFVVKWHFTKYSRENHENISHLIELGSVSLT